jgi:hypothetical protein
MSFVSPKCTRLGGEPQENYKNYVKLMDSMTINEELQKIQNIHHSLDDKNPITYAILLETNRKWFTPSQITWIHERIDTLHERNRLAFENSLQNVDIELAKKPICDKMSDVGEQKLIEEV